MNEARMPKSSYNHLNTEIYYPSKFEVISRSGLDFIALTVILTYYGNNLVKYAN